MSELEQLPEGYHSRRQTMVEPDPPREGYASANALVGYRSDVILKGSFPNSPIMWTDNSDDILTDKGQTQTYRDIIEDGIISGYEFPTGVQFNYEGSPDVSSVAPSGDKGGAGNPMTAETLEGNAWPVPNPVSSPHADPYLQQSYEGPEYIQRNINFGCGPTSPQNPSVTSSEIGSQDFTSLDMGSRGGETRVGADSNGKITV